MKKMNEKKFLQQMYGKLENQLEQEVKLADDSKGDMLYSADKQFSNIVNKLHGKIENDVRNTKEFLKVKDPYMYSMFNEQMDKTVTERKRDIQTY